MTLKACIPEILLLCFFASSVDGLLKQTSSQVDGHRQLGAHTLEPKTSRSAPKVLAQLPEKHAAATVTAAPEVSIAKATTAAAKVTAATAATAVTATTATRATTATKAAKEEKNIDLQSVEALPNQVRKPANTEDSAKAVRKRFHVNSPNVSVNAAGLEASRTSETLDRKWLGVCVLTSLMFLAITPILVKDGIAAFLITIMYLASLALVKFFVKDAMKEKLELPYTISLCHMASTAFVALLLELRSTVAEGSKWSMSEALSALPISIVNGMSLGLNNTALLYGGVAFVSMIGCSTPAFTWLLELIGRKRELTFKAFIPVFIVCVGASLCVKGEATASILATLLAVAATAFRSLKSAWQHELLTINVAPMRLIFWTGFWSMLFYVPLVVHGEGLGAFYQLGSATSAARFNFFMSCICASALNICQVFAVKQLGPLMQNVLGNMNIILVIILSAAWLQEEVRSVQYAGTLLLVAGAIQTKGLQFTAQSPQKASCKQLPISAQLLAGDSSRLCDHRSELKK